MDSQLELTETSARVIDLRDTLAVLQQEVLALRLDKARLENLVTTLRAAAISITRALQWEPGQQEAAAVRELRAAFMAGAVWAAVHTAVEDCVILIAEEAERRWPDLARG